MHHKQLQFNFHKHINIPMALSLCGLIITSTQLILSFFDMSLCHSAGCSVVAITAHSELMYISGAAYFLALVYSFHKKNKDWQLRLIYTGFICETIFIADQIWLIEEICTLCICIAVLILAIAITSPLEYKQWNNAITFSCAVFVALTMVSPGIMQGKTSLSLPAGVTSTLPSPMQSKDQIYLIYSDNCEHCTKTLELLSEKTKTGTLPKVHLNSIDNICNRRVLSSLGIEKVPVLCVQTAGSTEFFSDDLEIRRYLLSAENVAPTSIPIKKHKAASCSVFIPCT